MLITLYMLLYLILDGEFPLLFSFLDELRAELWSNMLKVTE